MATKAEIKAEIEYMNPKIIKTSIDYFRLNQTNLLAYLDKLNPKQRKIADKYLGLVRIFLLKKLDDIVNSDLTALHLLLNELRETEIRKLPKTEQYEMRELSPIHHHLDNFISDLENEIKAAKKYDDYIETLFYIRELAKEELGGFLEGEFQNFDAITKLDAELRKCRKDHLV